MAVETTNIVDRGDVILVLGEGDTSLQLKVNSQMLRAGSEVFEAMFGGNFAEGQNLSYDKPKEVNLEDDPQAMKVICLVLHFKYKQVPDLLDVQEVYNLAVVVDKYGLQEPLKVVVGQWLQPNSLEGVTLLLEAAILLDHAVGFEEITRYMIMHHHSFPNDRSSARALHDLSAECLKAIVITERKREQIRATYSAAIFTDSMFNPVPGCQCGYASRFQARVMSNLRNVGVTPNYIAGVSLYTIFALTRQKLTLPGPGLDPLCDKVNHAPMYWLRKKLIENVERIADFSGISLDWLK